MARCYTVNFTHNKKPYTAVVTQLQSSLSVYIPDESLHHLLPQGKFSYEAGQGLRIGTSGLSPRTNLMLDVLVAIELQSTSQQTNTA